MDVRVWTIKKAECWRIDAFELWCWRRFLKVPWTARTSNQSILKEISPEYSLGGLMLKLKLQYFGHLMQRTDSFEKTLMLGKIEGRRRRGWQGMRWLDGVPDSVDMSWVSSGSWCFSPWGRKESDTTARLNWTGLEACQGSEGTEAGTLWVEEGCVWGKNKFSVSVGERGFWGAWAGGCADLKEGSHL